MMNFINNGGLELILATGYMCYVLVMAKIEDRRTFKINKAEKWNWD